MRVKQTFDTNEIQQYYSIVSEQYYGRLGIKMDKAKLINEHAKKCKSPDIYVADDSKIVGGFQLCSKKTNSIPCEDYIEDISKYLPEKLNRTKNYCEVSKLVMDKNNSKRSFYSYILFAAWNIMRQTNHDGLVFIAPKAQSVLYKKTFEIKKLGKLFEYHVSNQAFTADKFDMEFFLTAIFKT